MTYSGCYHLAAVSVTDHEQKCITSTISLCTLYLLNGSAQWIQMSNLICTFNLLSYPTIPAVITRYRRLYATCYMGKHFSESHVVGFSKYAYDLHNDSKCQLSFSHSNLSLSCHFLCHTVLNTAPASYLKWITNECQTSHISLCKHKLDNGFQRAAQICTFKTCHFDCHQPRAPHVHLRNENIRSSPIPCDTPLWKSILQSETQCPTQVCTFKPTIQSSTPPNHLIHLAHEISAENINPPSQCATSSQTMTINIQPKSRHSNHPLA